MEPTTAFALLVPVVTGLVELVKTAGFPSRFAGVLSLLLGLGGAFLIGGEAISVLVLQGIIVGLSASGLYSATRATFNV